MNLTAKFIGENEDEVAQLMYELQKNKSFKYARLRNLFFLALTIFGLVFTVMNFKGHELEFNPPIFLWIGFFVFLATYSYFRLPFTYRKQYEKFVSEKSGDHLGEESIVQLEENEITCIEWFGEIKLKLSACSKITETRDHFFVRFEGGLTIRLPKKSLPDPINWKNAFQNIASKFGKQFVEDLEWYLK